VPDAEALRRALERGLEPLALRIEDESALHAGHRPGAPATGTHFSVEIVAAAFEGLSRLGRHRLVYEALAEALRDPELHALRIRAFSPSERPPAGHFP
jgi:BolA protein